MCGAIMGGALLATLAGLLGALVPATATLAAAVIAATYSLWWHASDKPTFRGSRSGWQADREIAMRTRLGRVYFGGLLGFGIATYMSTPLVYTLSFYAAATHLPNALVAGVGFGLGRSRPIATGLRARGGLSPAVIANRFAHPVGSDRVLGCFIAAGILAALIATAG